MIPVWEPFVAYCPLSHASKDCAWMPQILNYWDLLDDHLKTHHNYGIDRPMEILPYLEDYLNCLSTLKLPLDSAQESKLRSESCQKHLLFMCQLQEQERQMSFNRKCLFCKDQFSRRLEYFEHLKEIHGFNTGHPDNLVKINKLLNFCQDLLDKNICISCKKEFPDSLLLRRHMRKKKHFKINSIDTNFDQFYMINYKKEKDAPLEDHQEDEAGYSDWEEDTEKDEVTMCLFDGKIFTLLMQRSSIF